MELLCPGGALLLLLGGALIGALLVGFIVLVKLGVIMNYATRDEEPDRGEYSLDESREAGK
jgi:hypothetical protein